MAQKVDRSDPRFRHVAYSLYRDLLNTYHDPGMTLAGRVPSGICNVPGTALVELVPVTNTAVCGSDVTQLIDIM